MNETKTKTAHTLEILKGGTVATKEIHVQHDRNGVRPLPHFHFEVMRCAHSRTDEERIEFAGEVVRRFNSHPALLEALQEARKDLVFCGHRNNSSSLLRIDAALTLAASGASGEAGK